MAKEKGTGKKDQKSFQDLRNLAKRLRSETGCPWDRKQTIVSMLKHLEEEAQEVRQAIENGDHDNLREELGDVLFQIIMISQIAEDQEYFHMGEVLNDVYEKIVSRHTWVFGEDKAKTPEEALILWKKNKAKEKNRNKK